MPASPICTSGILNRPAGEVGHLSEGCQLAWLQRFIGVVNGRDQLPNQIPHMGGGWLHAWAEKQHPREESRGLAGYQAPVPVSVDLEYHRAGRTADRPIVGTDLVHQQVPTCGPCANDEVVFSVVGDVQGRR